jgi:hypothetical protein
MSWTYLVPPNSQIDPIRLLIHDTDSANPVFSNEEILLAYTIQGNVFQSAQFWSYPGGAYVPNSPVSYLRVAALLLDSLASNSARLAGVVQLLDVKLDLSKAAVALKDEAKTYREVDDDSGAIFIIEQVNNTWSFKQRWWKQFQRGAAF